MSPIRIGFIGLSGQGWASTMLAPPLFEEPLSSQYQLTAVSTSNPDSAEATAAKYASLSGNPVKPYHGYPEHIVSDPNVDLVAVSVKVMDHFENAMKVIDGGKVLFLEWPAGNGLKETSALTSAAREKGVRTIVGLQGRMDPVFRKVKAIVDSGEIGRILSTSLTARTFPELKIWGSRVSSANALYSVNSHGGTLLDIKGGHIFDTLTFVLGPVANVSATLSTQYPIAAIVDENGKPTGETIEQDAPTQVAVSGVLTNGAVMSVHIRGGLQTRSDGKAGTPLLWVIDGEKGSIRMESDNPMASAVSFMTPTTLYVNGEEVKIEGNGLTNVRRVWEAYAKGEGYVDLEAALKTKTLIDAIQRSAKEGRRVDL
ncbi:NAD-binding Rossmann fold oxidoreductase [Desarmillaria tabescens]|uniref:NAD-binding Rossmann fold oxidoreductase n=1 Tax=Armillaria tabescens TaxID=1929756 RepID=A0AA39JSD5_ARMTA|nr:NAD-binding Rossmann fold oxidoreductase [Desarmillaria tabescens]KAK0446589.1 NAD-binding Rossmann fold oxidoreductase [Desarmillaria tabescens]